MTLGLEGPEHADTLPAESSSSTRPTTASVRGGGKASMCSHEPINVSFREEGDDEEEKPRKRRTLLGKFGDQSDDEEASIASDHPEDKQRFTVAGQLKATILNSWINILILAAPVGSEYSCSN